jgi:hypothetical protein
MKIGTNILEEPLTVKLSTEDGWSFPALPASGVGCFSC